MKHIWTHNLKLVLTINIFNKLGREQIRLVKDWLWNKGRKKKKWRGEKKIKEKEEKETKEKEWKNKNFDDFIFIPATERVGRGSLKVDI